MSLKYEHRIKIVCRDIERFKGAFSSNSTLSLLLQFINRDFQLRTNLSLGLNKPVHSALIGLVQAISAVLQYLNRAFLRSSNSTTTTPNLQPFTHTLDLASTSIYKISLPLTVCNDVFRFLQILTTSTLPTHCRSHPSS